jgi:group I intron endonuclease
MTHPVDPMTVSTGCVYLIRNTINGKCYIGQTRCNVIKRFHQHVKKAERGSFGPLHSAMKKYGSDSFELSVLDTPLLENLSSSEVSWIKNMKTLSPDGYNISRGGNAPPIIIGDDVKKKISMSLRGHKISAETRRKIADSLRGRKLQPEIIEKIKASLAQPECRQLRSKTMTGKKRNQITKNKLSESSKKMWSDPKFHADMSKTRQGSGNSRALITEQNVVQIKTEWKNYDASSRGAVTSFCEMMGRKFNVNAPVIFRLIRCHSWKHVILTTDTTSDLRQNNANNTQQVTGHD